MLGHRYRFIVYAVIALAVVWVLAATGFALARKSKVTAEKVAQQLRTVDLSTLSAEERAKTLRELARKMTALNIDERRRARLDGEWERWFGLMTEEEKGTFIEATMPSGFKQMVVSFEQLPEPQRKRAVEDALRQMKRAQEGIEKDNPEPGLWRSRTNRIELSADLQKKVVKIGLKSFYGDSSAQTKAELAPLLEEIQRTMERGALFHDHR
jgi:hypothetical protein